jgi:hypothetical protein
MKNVLTLLFATALITSGPLHANEDSLPVDDANAIPLDGFPGCQVAPPRDGCDTRISCVGEANILYMDSAGRRDATKRASLNARKQLADFFANKVKAKEAMYEAQKTIATDNASGRSASREMEVATAEMVEAESEELLSGVVTLGITVSKEDKLVQIKIGQSCKSKLAAAAGRAAPASGNSSGDSDGGGATSQSGGPDVFDDGAVRNQRSTVKDPDNF